MVDAVGVRRFAAVLAVLTLVGSTGEVVAAQDDLPPQGVELLSLAADGAPSEPGAASTGAAVSASGRWVAFESVAPLDPLAQLGTANVYVRDRTNPSGLTLLSRGSPSTALAPGETMADGPSAHPAISADGRYVAFDTAATNLAGVVPQADRTAVVICDRDPDGDGVFDERRVDGSLDLRYTMVPGEPFNADRRPDLSAEAGVVVWTRDPDVSPPVTMTVTLTKDEAGQLVTPNPGTETILLPQVPGMFTMGADGPARVSADGAHVVFPVVVCAVIEQCTFALAGPRLLTLNGAAAPPPSQPAVFVADLPGLRMSRVDDPAAGGADRGVLSGDGATIALVAGARLWLVRRGPDGTPASSAVIPTPAAPAAAALSADGRYLVFATADGRILVRDLTVDDTRAAAGLPRLPDQPAAPRACERQQIPCAAAEPAGSVALAANGSVIAFDSAADDLVAGDTNGAADVFARPFRPNVVADPVDFGQTLTSTVRVITVRHNGFGPLRIDSVSTGGAFGLEQGETCAGTTLYETGQCVVPVRFTPTGPGAVTGELVIGTATGTWRVALRASRGPAVVHLSALPAQLAFAGERLALTSSGPATVRLTSDGLDPVTVRDLRLLTGSLDYRVDRGCVGAVLTPGQSCVVSVVSTPTGGGPRPGVLLVDTDNPAGTVVIPLASTGIRPVLIVDPAVTQAGRVVWLSGTGFPPDRPVLVAAPGLVPPVVADADGRFGVPLVVYANAVGGPQPVTALGTEPAAETSLLVQAGTYQPPDFRGRR